MKNYIIITSVVCLLLSFLGTVFNISFYFVLFAVFLALAVICAVNRNSKVFKSFVFFCFAAIFCFRMITQLAVIEKVENIDGKNVYLDALVIESAENVQVGQAKTATLKVISHSESFDKGDKLLYKYYTAEYLKIGQRITGEFEVVSLSDNYSKLNNYSNGIYARVKQVDVTIRNGNNIFYNTVASFRDFVKQTLHESTKNSGVLIAMIYGENGYISNSLYSFVKACGVSHVLVVSGLHFSLIFGVASFLCRFIKLKGIFKDIVLLLLCLAYMLVCGFSVSVIRAGFVYVLMLASRYLKRIASSLDSLLVVLIAVLLINPFAFYSISFQLSFEATFGILVLYPQIEKSINFRLRNNKLLKGVAKTAAVSISAYVMTLPTIVYYFSYLSIFAVAVNVFIGFAVSVMLAACVISLLISALGLDIIARIGFVVADAFADYFKRIVEFFGKLPFSILRLKHEKLLVVLILVSYFVVFELYTCKCRNTLVKLLKRIKKEGSS